MTLRGSIGLIITRIKWYVVFTNQIAYNLSVDEETKFFKKLGARIRELRQNAGCSQEDMISHGYSVRYWQKVESGKPITLRTLYRICHLFSAPMSDIVRDIDDIPKRNIRARQ